MTAAARNSLLCPRCRKLISADEAVCPYCGLSRPARKLFLTLLRFTTINPLLITVNIVFYLLSLLISLPRLNLHPDPFSFFSPSQEALFLLGATGTIPISLFGRWWTLISASFLHGSLLHILFNMLALAQLGPFVEREFGPYRFLIIFTISGLSGFLLSYLAGIPFTIGASAAICGFIGAILYYGRSRGGLYGYAVYRQAVGWILGLIVYGLLFSAINNWAHGGGVLAGFVSARLLGYEDKNPTAPLHKLGGFICLGITVAVLLWSLWAAFSHFL